MWNFVAKANELAEKAKSAASEAAKQAAIQAEELKKAAVEAAEQAQASDLLNQAKAAASNAAVAASKHADNLTDSLSRAAQQAEANIRTTLLEDDVQVVRINPSLMVIEFPSEEKIGRLSEQLNRDLAERMLVYNMSERRYDTSRFQGEVIDVAFRGLPAPPLTLLMELCLSAEKWLSQDQQNVLVVHCFLGFSRSAIFLSCFMAFRGLCSHPVDALHEVCQHLGIDDAHSVLPSQRRYLTYFQQCQQGFAPASTKLRLVRVTLNSVPKLEAEGSVACRLYVEVWNHGELVYGSFTPPRKDASPDDDAPKAPASIEVGEPCACFNIPDDVLIFGDVLLRIRHVRVTDGSIETACRMAFNTAFVPEGLQLAKHELDGACDDERFPEDCFVDLAFDRVDSDDREVPPVFEKARELSKQLCQAEERRREEERRRREREAERAREEEKKRKEVKDEFDDLEALLNRSSTAVDRPAVSSESKRAASISKPSESTTDLKKALAEATADTQADTKANTIVQSNTPEPTASEVVPKATVEDLVKESDKDIDDLFNDFDAAIASVGVQSKPAAVTAPAPAVIDTIPKSTTPVEESKEVAPSSSTTAESTFAPPPRSDTEALVGKPTPKAQPEPEKKTTPAPTKADEDPFADMDAFLAELEG